MDPISIISLIAVILPLVSQLIPVFTDLIKSIVSVENQAQVAPAPVSGADKKATVLNVFNTLWTQLTANPPGKSKIFQLPATTVTPIVSSVVDLAVGFFNSVGIFKKATPAPLK